MKIGVAPEHYDRRDQQEFRANVEQGVTTLELRGTSHPISGDRGDGNVTLVADTDLNIQRFATALSANRTVTLGAGVQGSWFRIVRTGLGAFTLDVGGLKTIPNSTAAYVDVGHDGTAWFLTAYGAL